MACTALADGSVVSSCRARLVSHIVEERGAEESKVLSFGGSYPGNLAAWFRLKYPHITDGSIASSAPLRAKTNFSEYMEVVTGTTLPCM